MVIAIAINMVQNKRNRFVAPFFDPSNLTKITFGLDQKLSRSMRGDWQSALFYLIITSSHGDVMVAEALFAHGLGSARQDRQALIGKILAGHTQE